MPALLSDVWSLSSGPPASLRTLTPTATREAHQSAGDQFTTRFTQNIILDELSIGLEAEIDLHTFLGLTDGNAGFENIRATVRLVSDSPPEKIEALHAKVAATSPAGHTLSRAVPLTIAPA